VVPAISWRFHRRVAETDFIGGEIAPDAHAELGKGTDSSLDPTFTAIPRLFVEFRVSDRDSTRNEQELRGEVGTNGTADAAKVTSTWQSAPVYSRQVGPWTSTVDQGTVERRGRRAAAPFTNIL